MGEQAPAPPRALGSGYELIDVLGRGGGGEVWRGRRRDTGLEVAVKVLRSDLCQNAAMVDRFLQERAILRDLRHPHLIRVLDLVVEADTLAIVMPLVPGGDLADWLAAHGPLTLAGAVDVGTQVLDVLAALHQHGVIHRDVKPQNLLVDGAGPLGPSVLLTDLGIARLADGPSRTSQSQLIGTTDYLAPEVIAGRPPTPAVDVYSTGILLYALIAGATPFAGAHPLEILRRHADVEPERPAAAPDALWSVLAAMLAKDPAARPSAVVAAGLLRAGRPLRADLLPPTTELLLAAGAAAAAVPQPTGPTLVTPPSEAPTLVRVGAEAEAGPPAPPGRWRRPGWAAVSVAAAVVLAAGGGGTWLLTGGQGSVAPDRSPAAVDVGGAAVLPMDPAASSAAPAPPAEPSASSGSGAAAPVDPSAKPPDAGTASDVPIGAGPQVLSPDIIAGDPGARSQALPTPWRRPSRPVAPTRGLALPGAAAWSRRPRRPPRSPRSQPAARSPASPWGPPCGAARPCSGATASPTGRPRGSRPSLPCCGCPAAAPPASPRVPPGCGPGPAAWRPRSSRSPCGPPDRPRRPPPPPPAVRRWPRPRADRRPPAGPAPARPPQPRRRPRGLHAACAPTR